MVRRHEEDIKGQKYNVNEQERNCESEDSHSKHFLKERVLLLVPS